MRTDDLVREALADLAPTAPADATALAGVHRAIGRRRRRQHVARAVAAVALAAVAIGIGALVLRAEDDRVDVGTGGDGRPKITTETTEAPTPDASGRTTFGPVSFEVPPGWEAGPRQKETDPDTGAQGESMCIAPVGDTGPTWEDCSGLVIYQGDYLPGEEGRPYQPHVVGSWNHSTDTNQCPFTPYVPGQELDGVNTVGAPIDQGTRPVGDRIADHDRWQATCQLSGHSFEPQAWYLPRSKVLIFDMFDHPETEAFLASFQFDG